MLAIIIATLRVIIPNLLITTLKPNEILKYAIGMYYRYQLVDINK